MRPDQYVPLVMIAGGAFMLGYVALEWRAQRAMTDDDCVRRKDRPVNFFVTIAYQLCLAVGFIAGAVYLLLRGKSPD